MECHTDRHYNHSHFTGEKTEAQICWVTSPRQGLETKSNWRVPATINSFAVLLYLLSQGSEVKAGEDPQPDSSRGHSLLHCALWAGWWAEGTLL